MKKSRVILNGILIAIFAMIPLLFIQGCSDDDAVTPTAIDNASISMYGTANYTDLLDSLKLDTVKVLIRDIKLNVANSSDSTNFKVGPFVYFLNLNGSVNQMTTAQIPAGSYDKIKFEFHKLGDSETPPDPEFKDSTGRYSTVVKGYFNGAYFVFKSDVSFHQKLNFPTSIPVASDVQTNITLTAEPYKWFYKNGNWLDPNNPVNRNDIENNIKNNVNNNFKAYKDNNKDGIPD
jgi:hypothetical protein